MIDGPNNTVGGTTAPARNVIAGNALPIYGGNIDISGSGATGNLITGNDIGTDATGGKIRQQAIGVEIQDASGNTIGGTLAGSGNVISGTNAPYAYTGGDPGRVSAGVQDHRGKTKPAT